MSHKIKELYIENYKGIENLKLNNLSKVNILVGANNTKKTTILEAVVIGKSYYQGFSGVTTANSRDLFINSDNLKSLFFNLDTTKKIRISTLNEFNENRYEVTYSQYKEFPSQDKLLDKVEVLFNCTKNQETFYSSKIRVDKNGELSSENIISISNEEQTSVDYVSSRSKRENILIEKLNKVKLSKNKKNLITILKQMEPSISDLEEINGVVYIDLEGIQELLPLKLMGDGIYNLLDIALTVTLENKIILIDEIENGMHYYALKEVLKDILKRVHENDYQLFITTHSLDTLNVIRDILRFELQELDISFINLKNLFGKIEAKILDKPSFLEKMSEGWEIR